MTKQIDTELLFPTLFTAKFYMREHTLLAMPALFETLKTAELEGGIRLIEISLGEMRRD